MSDQPEHGEPTNSEVDPRVVLAEERTMLAWVRTGLALMGFGFVLARFGLFMRELVAAHQLSDPHAPQVLPQHQPGFSLWAGVGMIGLGVVVLLYSNVRHRRIV